MKKKGLIISTVVMVVVLIASLTTATYAWFTAANVTEVEEIGFSVSSDSDLKIGVSGNNTIVATGIASPSNFYSGEGLTYSQTGNSWSGGDNTLGFYINTGLQLNSIKKAVFTGTITDEENMKGTVDSTLNPTGTWIKAAGKDTEVTEDTIEKAIANTDYLDVAFGVAAAKANITGIKLVIGVNPSSTSSTLGMNAAIAYAYQIRKVGTEETAGAWTTGQVYDQSKYTFTTEISKVPAPTETISGITWTQGAQTAVIPIITGSTALNTTDIYQIHLKLFIDGTDVDCNSNATDVASTITINFVADKVAP